MISIPPTTISEAPQLDYERVHREHFFKCRTTRWTFAAGILSLVIAIGLFVYFRFFWTLDININFGPRPIAAVREPQWDRLAVGMTKAQVVALLGRSASQCVPAPTTNNGRSGQRMPEFWEFNWTDGMFALAPSSKAYVIYFDATGRVSGWRKPEGT